MADEKDEDEDDGGNCELFDVDDLNDDGAESDCDGFDCDAPPSAEEGDCVLEVLGRIKDLQGSTGVESESVKLSSHLSSISSILGRSDFQVLSIGILLIDKNRF